MLRTWDRELKPRRFIVEWNVLHEIGEYKEILLSPENGNGEDMIIIEYILRHDPNGIKRTMRLETFQKMSWIADG